MGYDGDMYRMLMGKGQVLRFSNVRWIDHHPKAVESENQRISNQSSVPRTGTEVMKGVLATLDFYLAKIPYSNMLSTTITGVMLRSRHGSLIH